MSKTIKIAVDAMGSDFGPAALVRGTFQYLHDHIGNGVKLYIIGKQSNLAKLWDSIKNKNGIQVEFVDAPEVVEMNEPIAKGLKKRNSSLAIAMGMQRAGEIDAVVSAGNTGACMATAIRQLGRIEGVIRPAIASPFPTSFDKDVVLLDVGANVDSPPKNLLQFAMMGSIYMSHMTKNKRPTVGLLSIGEEKIKGNEATILAYKLLEESSLNFIGNIEGHDILSGRCDVVVTDGFTGNVLLKFTESIKTFLVTKVGRQVSSNLFSRAGAILLSPFLKRLRNSFDSSKYGGAPLLGINGVVIVAHGASNPLAIKNAIRVAHRMVEANVTEHIHGKLADTSISVEAK